MKHNLGAAWVVLVLGLMGCRCQQRPAPVCVPAAPAPCPASVPAPPAPPAGAIPAPSFPTAPPAPTNPGMPPAFYPPPQKPPVDFQPSPPALPPTDPQTKVDYRWHPADKVPSPPPVVQEDRVKLGVPEPLDTGKIPDPPKLPPSDFNPLPKDNPIFPASIPQFHRLHGGVAAGLRPSMDGLDWLKENGFKTVLFLRGSAEPDDADRREIDKRGLKYLALDLAPETLTKTQLAEFVQLVQAKENQPIFVYDLDGSLAGALWYYYFRAVDNDSDDIARIRARGLGLRETGSGRHGAMWQAVVKALD